MAGRPVKTEVVVVLTIASSTHPRRKALMLMPLMYLVALVGSSVISTV